MNTPLSPHQQSSAVVAQICGTQYKIESLSSVATLAMTHLQTWSQETAGQFNSYFTPTKNRQSNTWTHTTQRPNHSLHTNKDALLLHGFQTQWWNWESLPTGRSGNDTCSNLATGSSQILRFILYPYRNRQSNTLAHTTPEHWFFSQTPGTWKDDDDDDVPEPLRKHVHKLLTSMWVWMMPNPQDALKLPNKILSTYLPTPFLLFWKICQPGVSQIRRRLGMNKRVTQCIKYLNQKCL